MRLFRPLSHQFCQFCQLAVLAENTSVYRKRKWPWQVCSMRSQLYFFFLNCLKIGKSLCLSMHDYIGFKMYLWLLFVLACVGSCVCSHVYVVITGQLRGVGSPSFCGFRGLNSGCRPWVASFALWAVSPDHKLVLKCFIRLKFVRVWIINQIF